MFPFACPFPVPRHRTRRLPPRLDSVKGGVSASHSSIVTTTLPSYLGKSLLLKSVSDPHVQLEILDASSLVHHPDLTSVGTEQKPVPIKNNTTEIDMFGPDSIPPVARPRVSTDMNRSQVMAEILTDAAHTETADITDIGKQKQTPVMNSPTKSNISSKPPRNINRKVEFAEQPEETKTRPLSVNTSTPSTSSASAAVKASPNKRSASAMMSHAHSPSKSGKQSPLRQTASGANRSPLTDRRKNTPSPAFNSGAGSMGGGGGCPSSRPQSASKQTRLTDQPQVSAIAVPSEPVAHFKQPPAGPTAAELAREKQRKMFEPSAAMLDLFPFSGSQSHFQKVSHTELTDPNAFKRINVLERESTTLSPKKTVKSFEHSSAVAGNACFETVPDHNAAAARAQQISDTWNNQSRLSTQATFDVVPDHSQTQSTKSNTRHKVTEDKPDRSPPVRREWKRHQQSSIVFEDGSSASPVSSSNDRYSYQRVPQGSGFGGGGGGAPSRSNSNQSNGCVNYVNKEIGDQLHDEHQLNSSQNPNPVSAQHAHNPNPSTSSVVELDTPPATPPPPNINHHNNNKQYPPLTDSKQSSRRASIEGTGADMDLVEPIVTAKQVEVVSAQPFMDGGGATELFIKGGHVVNDDAMFVADVHIKDALIKQVGANLRVPGSARVIDATGKFVIPGGIDTQTHLQHSFMGATAVDDFVNGTSAALAGGTTMIMDVVYPAKGESLASAYERYRSLADPNVCCDYALSVLVPNWAANGSTAQQMRHLCEEKGINSFVLCMAYKEWGVMLRDDQLYHAMDTCRQMGALARVHAENGDVIAEKSRQLMSLGVSGPEGHLQARAEELEAEATNRACVLAKQTNCPVYILHVTSKWAADVIAKYRKLGVVVYGEPTVAALGTDGTHHYNTCWRHAAGHVTAPPLRPDALEMGRLMDMLSGGELQVVCSDHRTHTAQHKALGRHDFMLIPHGVNGVEERMCVVWEQGVHSGKMDPMKFVAVTSTNAAKIFNLYPKKGRIAAGADADVVVWDAAAKRTISAKVHESKCDFNIFEGITCHGIALYTIAAGRVVYEADRVSAKAGMGRFVPLPTHAPFVYSVIQQRDKMCVPRKVDRSGDTGSKQTTLSRPGSAARSVQRATHLESQITLGAESLTSSDQSRRGTKKISQPPGGKSSGLW